MSWLQFLQLRRVFLSFWVKQNASASSLFPSQSPKITSKTPHKIDILPAASPRSGGGLLHTHSLLQRPAWCFSDVGQRVQIGHTWWLYHELTTINNSENTQWRHQGSITRDSTGFTAGQRSSVVDSVWFCPLGTSTWPESSWGLPVPRQVPAHWESSASSVNPSVHVRILAGCQNRAWCLAFDSSHSKWRSLVKKDINESHAGAPYFSQNLFGCTWSNFSVERRCYKWEQNWLAHTGGLSTLGRT